MSLHYSFAEFKEARERRSETLRRDLNTRTEVEYVQVGDLELRLHPAVFNPRLGEGSQLLVEAGKHLDGGATVLEIGCGAGGFLVQAGLQHCSGAGVDISEAAVTCTEENLALNGITKFEVFHGELFEPVPPEAEFDYVVFNPPFLLGRPSTPPERAILDDDYRVFAAFLAGLPSHLKVGGEVWLCFGEAGDTAYYEWATRSASLTRIGRSARPFGGLAFFLDRFTLA